MKRYRICGEVLFWVSIAAAVIHFVWAAVVSRQGGGLQGALLNVLPYGLPILTFALVRRALRRAEPCWGRADILFAALFSLCYLAMIVHVTVGGIAGDFDHVYYNMPLLYAIPLAAVGLVWAAVRIRPTAEMPVAGKILYALPFAALAAMCIHCGTLAIIEGMRGVTSSFPWWAAPLLCSIPYLLAALALFGAYAVYRRVCRSAPRA